MGSHSPGARNFGPTKIEIRARTPKLRFHLNVLPTWHLYSLRGSSERVPKTQGRNLKGPRCRPNAMDPGRMGLGDFQPSRFSGGGGSGLGAHSGQTPVNWPLQTPPTASWHSWRPILEWRTGSKVLQLPRRLGCPVVPLFPFWGGFRFPYQPL